jgi:hypothetical protein
MAPVDQEKFRAHSRIPQKQIYTQNVDLDFKGHSQKFKLIGCAFPTTFRLCRIDGRIIHQVSCPLQIVGPQAPVWCHDLALVRGHHPVLVVVRYLAAKTTDTTHKVFSDSSLTTQFMRVAIYLASKAISASHGTGNAFFFPPPEWPFVRCGYLLKY